MALLAEGEGAVISASHNPPEHNGVKFFAADGRKLTDEEEVAVEGLLDAPGPGGGEVVSLEGLGPRYIALVSDRFGSPLEGLSLVVDCANGAFAGLAPPALEALGARVTVVGGDPDGNNINVGCGATDPRLLSETVRGGRYDLGLAFDGDGDRLIAVDARGALVNGDAVLAILALSLGVDTVAVTVLTNAGFHELMAERGINVLTTDVGDRYLVETLRREGGLLGGEPSGHVVYLDGHTTGDGLVAAMLCVAHLSSRAERSQRRLLVSFHGHNRARMWRSTQPRCRLRSLTRSRHSTSATTAMHACWCGFRVPNPSYEWSPRLETRHLPTNSAVNLSNWSGKNWVARSSASSSGCPGLPGARITEGTQALCVESSDMSASDPLSRCYSKV